MVVLRENIGNVFRRVAGRVPRGDEERSKPELVAVFDRFGGEAVARARFVAREDFCRTDTTA